MHSKMFAIIPVALVISLLPIHCIDINGQQELYADDENGQSPYEEATQEDHYARYEMIFQKRAAQLEFSKSQQKQPIPNIERHSLSWVEEIKLLIFPEQEQQKTIRLRPNPLTQQIERELEEEGNNYKLMNNFKPLILEEDEDQDLLDETADQDITRDGSGEQPTADEDGDVIPDEVVPHKVDFKQMCQGNTDQDNNCIVDGGIIKLSKSSSYSNQDIVSLVLKNTKMECIDEKTGDHCDITILLANKWKNTAGGCCQMTYTNPQCMASEYDDGICTKLNSKSIDCAYFWNGIADYNEESGNCEEGGQPQPMMSLLKNTEIKARSISIIIKQGRLIIDHSSSLNTSGTSSFNKGTVKGQGASYIGDGGSCAKIYHDKHYGQFDMKPGLIDEKHVNLTEQFFGSIGHSRDQGTSGGGSIFIDVDSFNLQGNGHQIQANGAPFKDLRTDQDISAGSGGYIYINARQELTRSKVDYKANIEVIGGYGKNEGYGGSGGIVYYDGKFTGGMRQTHIEGGLGGLTYKDSDPVGCANGAAGTVFWMIYDSLMIDNASHDSDKYTTVDSTLDRDAKNYTHHYMVANDIILSGNARVSIRSGENHEILAMRNFVMPTLDMVGKGTIRIDMPGTQFFTLKYVNHFYVGPDTLIDFSLISKYSRIETFEKDTFVYWGNINLGNIKFSKAFKIADHTNVINMLSTIEDVTHDAKEGGYVELYSKSIRFFYRSEIVAENAFIFANSSIIMYKGSKIESTLDHECSPDGNIDMYKCMDYDVNENKPIDLQYVLDYYNSQYGWTKKTVDNHYAEDISHMKTKVLTKWKVYLFSLDTLKIKGATVRAPRIGLCANSIKIDQSSLDANFKGCTADQGLGNKNRQGGCSGAGASHGGYGGSGGAASSEQSAIKTCKAVVAPPYWEGREARYDGSGGTSGDTEVTKGSTKNRTGGSNGGSGGGVIWLTATSTTEIKNSTIAADGHWGNLDNYDQKGSGGGSGGSIQLVTQNLRGNGQFSVKGGDGSKNGGGGGGGGRFAMNYLRPYKADSQPAQSYYWHGSIEYAGGKAGNTTDKFATDEDNTAGDGQQGTLFQSRCFPGYSGAFCSACPIGTFKSDYSYGACQPCINKPEMAYYTEDAQGTTGCSYECKFYGNSTEDPECLNPLGLEFEELGGAIPFFVLMLIFCMMCFMTFAMLQYKAQVIKMSLKGLPEKIYSVWQENDEQGRGRTCEQDYSLNDQCIWSHTHRMYFAGTNSIAQPWIIPKDFPADALSGPDKEKLLTFIENYNKGLPWDCCEQFLLYFISLLYYPCSKRYHMRLRRQKFKKLQIALYRAFPPQFWSDNGNNLTIRLGCSKDDYQLAYIDFLDFSRTKETWPGLRLPMPILLAGSGSANHPYRVDFVDDAYVKSLVLINYEFLKDKLTPFLENANSQLGKLSFHKLRPTLASDMNNIVRWIERTNKSMWNHFNVKCVLYICENSSIQTEAGVWRQSRKSFPLESIFIDAFPQMFQSMVDYVKFRVQTGKSEIRLLLLFKRFSMSKSIGTQMRTKRMHVQAGQDPRAAYRNAVQNQESILWDETDKDEEEMRVSYVGKQKVEEDENKYLAKGTDQEGEDGTFLPPRPVDTRIRAFAYSIDAAKMFEVAIRRPRNSCKYKTYGFKGLLQGIYMLFVNRHGSPTDSKDLSSFFMLYSVVLAIDVIILISFSFHAFFNQRNLYHFGIAFCFFFCLPYFTPLVATIAACCGSVSMLKLTGEMIAVTICINYPATFVLCIVNGDDPIYLITIALMLFFKMCLSILTAKIRTYLTNPRYSQNAQTLRKIMMQQARRRQAQADILGTGTMRHLDFMADDNVVTKKMLMGLEPDESLPNPDIDTSDLDIDDLRKKALSLK